MFRKLAKTVAAVALSAITFAVSVNAAPGIVTTQTLNVRSEASVSSSVIGTLSYGEEVNITSEVGEWYQIYINDSVAFVYAQYIAKQIEENGYFIEPVTDGEDIVEYAKTFIGTPYRYGGNGPNSFDCSGFVKYVYAHFDIELPRIAASQMSEGTAVSWENIQVGDLVFFRGGGHVGIYVGNNQYIHAPQTGRTVDIDEICRDVCAIRRVLD